MNKHIIYLRKKINNIFYFFLVIYSPVLIFSIYILFQIFNDTVIDKFKLYYFSSSLQEAKFTFNLIISNFQGNFSFLGMFFIFIISTSLIYQGYYYYKCLMASKLSWWSPEKWSLYISVFLFVFIHLQTLGDFSLNMDKGNYPEFSKKSIDFLKIFPAIIMSYLIIVIFNNHFFKGKHSEIEVLYLFLLVVLTSYIFNDIVLDDIIHKNKESYFINFLLYLFFSITISILNFSFVLLKYYYVPILFITVFNLKYISFCFNLIFTMVFYIQNGEVNLYILFLRIIDIINTFESLNIPSIVAIIAFFVNLFIVLKKDY